MSLAILTVNWDRGHDVIESFIPLVATCIRRNGSQPVALVDLQKDVEREIGIKIPSGALQAILRRCAKANLVQRKNNVYLPNEKQLNELDYEQTQSEALRKHGCLLDKLRTFVLARYELEWSVDDANKYVLNFLQEGSLPVLLAATEGDPLPPVRNQSQKVRHVLSAFARHLDEADPEGFDCLETVVKGHILSGVLFYPDIGQVATRFDRLDVYCDTPFLLPALGYAEEGEHAQCIDLIELLRDLGAGLKCFHHTREEVAGVLEGTAANLRSEGKTISEATDYSTSKHFSVGEIEEMVVKIDETLDALGIEVVDTPEWQEQPDEVALEERLKESIDYYRERAREKDAQSLAAVARLRGLRRMEKFESALAIFVTTNLALARVSSEFFREIETGRAIPICMPVSLMTRLAWIKKPMVAPELPKHVVMASAYAAINPPNPLWRKYLKEIERRRDKDEITDAQYHFLRSSREAREALMDKTFGREEAFSAGTLDEVLAHATTAIQAEAHAETETEREVRMTAEADAQAERGRRERLERALAEKVDENARIGGIIVGWAVAFVFGIAIIVGALATIPGFPLLEISSQPWRIIMWVCLLAFLGITLFAVVVKHISVLAVRRAISASIERQLQARGHQKLARLRDDAFAKEEPIDIRDG